MKKKHILSRLPNMAFLCGANCDNSMRTQFLDYVQSKHKHIFISGKATKNICSNERIIIAEKVEHLWDTCLKESNAGYDSLLEFEMDIAQLSSVIPVFLEGYGALVETGTFLCTPGLREKLLIIVNKKYFNKKSFIERAIIKNPHLSGKIIYYDNNNTNHNKKIFEEIFYFRENQKPKIDRRENSPVTIYFFLLYILCEWKTKEEIIEELLKNNILKKYIETLDNHIKILKSLGMIVEEPDFKKSKLLSLIRKDCSMNYKKSLPRNTFHEIDIFDQITSKIDSDKILLKYMKQFSDEDFFSYSYNKQASKGYKKPNQQLNVLQKQLKTRILNNKTIFPIHESAMAYVEKSNIRKNAEKHSNNQFILKMDLKQFFNSIKKNDFLKYLKNRKNQNFNDVYLEFICDIAFKDDSIKEEDCSLPIGASTSPIISNILLYTFDESVSKYSRSLGITYTRYADDLTFSHDEPHKLNFIENKVKEIIKKIPYPSNLSINNKKTVHMSKRGQRKITGLYLTPSGKISIGRNKKSYIKKLLRDYDKEKYKEKYKHIQGYLCFIKNVDEEFWHLLHDKYIKKNYRDENYSKIHKFHDLFYGNELSRKRKTEVLKHIKNV